MTVTKFVYVFDCPYHGDEIEALCFRAFQDENKDRWKKLEFVPKKVDFENGELDGYLDRCRTSTTEPAIQVLAGHQVKTIL